jgi:hypothetical protein
MLELVVHVKTTKSRKKVTRLLCSVVSKISYENKINTTLCTTVSSRYLCARVDTRTEVENIHAIDIPNTSAGLPRLPPLGPLPDPRIHLVFEYYSGIP